MLEKIGFVLLMLAALPFIMIALIVYIVFLAWDDVREEDMY